MSSTSSPTRRSGASTKRAEPRVAIAPAAVELRHAVLRVARRIRQERSSSDITPGQYSVLAVLDALGPQTPRELASHENVQPPSMTRTVAALEELGMVERMEHPTDGRQVLVSITDDGRAGVRETRQRRDAWLAQRVAELDPQERRLIVQATAILARIGAS